MDKQFNIAVYADAKDMYEKQFVDADNTLKKLNATKDIEGCEDAEIGACIKEDKIFIEKNG